MIIGLVLGIAASVWVARAAGDHRLADALPSPWMTASLGLLIVAAGWVTANVAPRFAAAAAGAAAPGAVYGAVVLAGDGLQQLAYGWSTVPITLTCLAIGAGLHAGKSGQKPWSARRSTAPRIHRVRTR